MDWPQTSAQASLERVLESCSLHQHSKNSKREARRLILHYCDSKSLLALRLVSQSINMWTSREEARYFRDIRVTLSLTNDSGITEADWDALRRIGHLARRVIFTLRVQSAGKKIEFRKRLDTEPAGSVRTLTLNPLPKEGDMDYMGHFTFTEPLIPLLGGVFREFDVANDEHDGLFKRVLELTPNMQSLCIRDQVIWKDMRRSEAVSDWGRTLVDEALVYLRSQLEETLEARMEELGRLEAVHLLDQVPQIGELSFLGALVMMEQLTRLEESLMGRIAGLPELTLHQQAEDLAWVKEVVKRQELIRLKEIVRLEEKLLLQRQKLCRLREQIQLPRLLELQLGSPLALWHFRAYPSYGSGGSPALGGGVWGTIKTLNITLPAAIPGRTRGRKRTVKKAVHDFLAEFAGQIEALGIGFALSPGGKPATDPGNPLVYDLDPEFEGGGEKTFFPALKRVGLRGMCLKWTGGLEEFFVERAPKCVDVVLTGCTFVSDVECRKFYGLFELQNAQRLSSGDVPLVLTRKLRLPGARGFRG